jgi:hypothetical protein
MKLYISKKNIKKYLTFSNKIHYICTTLFHNYESTQVNTNENSLKTKTLNI